MANTDGPGDGAAVDAVINGMEQLIPVINRLQDVMATLGVVDGSGCGIDLPQIAVVGAQSVGKSSVLESLVGRDFLPRGTGIVTRRPLVLQLRNVQGTQEWGEFGHASGVHFEDFDTIRREIERETERVTGSNKGISPHPIMLKVFSPHVIDLTLIDLPGITKVPVGDQPTDIEMQIRRMIMSFTTRPSCIILAVTAANTDLANSDSLKLARECDPDGVRTIGVITKCDMMDEGTDALDMLMGRVYPLKMGYVGVVCRSQKDINKRTRIRDALREEAKFFRTHAAYRSIAHRCGTAYLAVMLNQRLMYHIRDTLPGLKMRISHLLHEHESELLSYGDPLLESKSNPGALLLHYFSKFARNFQDAIDGRLCTSQNEDQLSGGARVNFIFHDWFGKALADFDPLAGLTDTEIRTAIRNATGPKASLFVPEGAFEILVRKQIGKLEAPSQQCVDQVYEELQNIVEKCDLPEMSRFSILRDRILDVVRGVLKRCLQPTNQMIANLIQIELAYLNTNHPDFVGGNKVMSDLYNLSTQKAVAVATPDIHALPPSTASSDGRRQLPPPTGALPSTTLSMASTAPYGDMTNGMSSDASTMSHSTPSDSSAPSSMLTQGFFNFLKKPSPPNTEQRPSRSNGGASAPTLLSRHQEAGGGPTASTARNAEQLAAATRAASSRQQAYASSSNTGLMPAGIRLPQMPSQVRPSDVPSERDNFETGLIKSLIISYFNIVRKNIADTVPKSIMYFMVNTAKDVLQRELVSQLYREEIFGDLLREADDVAERRAQCKETLKTLRAAMDIVSHVRDCSLED